MSTNYRSLHGVPGLIVAVGEEGRMAHLTAPDYHPQVQPPTTLHTLTGVFVEHCTSAWAVGAYGTVLRWRGRTWYSLTLTSPHQDLTAIWGVPGHGVWIGGVSSVLHYHPDRHAGNLIATKTPVVSIWGSGPDNVWILCREGILLHGEGHHFSSITLPGDPDEEWSAVTGSRPKAPVWLIGPSGFVRCFDEGRWHKLDSETSEPLTAALAPNLHELYVTTAGGELRHYDGYRWHTLVRSPFGRLNALIAQGGSLFASGANIFRHRLDEGT